MIVKQESGVFLQKVGGQLERSNTGIITFFIK